MKICHRDQAFLRALGGELTSGTRWKVLPRKGDVLLLMPARVGAIRAGARLYSPQSKVARLVTSAFLNGPLWRGLPGVDWEWRPDRPLARLLEFMDAPVGAILLGNPSADGRRALILTDEESPRVVKIGVGAPASDLVFHEKEFLKGAGEGSGPVPEVLVERGGENWEAFGCSFFERRTEVTLAEITKLLRAWLGAESRPMSTLPGWERLVGSSHPAAASIAEECRDLSLKPSLVHGDLAPWNARRRPDGEIVLIDWENGRKADVPCWDALHFVFQQAALVKNLESSAVEAEVRAAMKRGDLAELIEESGWGGHEDLLFSSYLLAMATEESHVTELLKP